MLKILKRNGEEVAFDEQKIVVAIQKANKSVGAADQCPEEKAQAIANGIKESCVNEHSRPSVEEVQNRVVIALMRGGYFLLAQNYITYRYQHELARKKNSTDDKIMAIVDGTSTEAKEENSNKNVDVVSVQRDYIAGTVSRDITRRNLLPPDIMRAHDDGVIHFHDADYFLCREHNCDLVNLDDMLQNGTVISGTMIERPHRFATACNIATQIIAQVSSCQYGGQSISLTALAKFVDVSRKAIRRDIEDECAITGITMTEEQKQAIVNRRVRQEVRAGVQTIQYQVITLMTTNGQAPFITVFMYLNEAKDDPQLKADLALCIEEMLHQRILGVKNESGQYIAPAFPKLIYVTEEDNITPDGEYWYLTRLAAECSAKRLTPDYISEKQMKQMKLSKGEEPGEGDVYTCMGCRSFLTPDCSGNGWNNIANAKNYEPGKPKYYGRFNQGVVTINLPYVAMASGGDEKKFWELFEENLELCHRALRIRHERLLGTTSDVAPMLWQYGALARLEKGEKIDKLLYGGYSTISLGYAGLYECVRYMKGVSHTDEEGKPFAIAVMQKMNDKCNEWKAAENIHYSLYGTPLESTTYKFAQAIRNKFGTVADVSDHDYITNSYHVNVRENIDAFQKLAFEAEFQALSPGGAISYVEVPDMKGNIPAVLSLIQFMYGNILYAEINTKSDYCQVCGYDGEIQIVEDSGRLVWECPHCKNRDQRKLNVARRTCGYIGTQFWNQGRTEEIRDRVLHL